MSTPVWSVIGNSVTGTSHQLRGRGCEDSFGWHLGPDLVAMAVADGAGSRPHAELGSRMAVSTILDWIRDAASTPDGTDLAAGFGHVRTALADAAAGVPCDPDDLATTLGVVVVGPDLVEVAQVGDTIIVVRRADGSLVIPSPPETFEYVNETVFVTADSALTHLRVDRYPTGTVTGAALSTDGLRFKILGDLATYQPYAPFFDDIFSYAGHEGANDAAVGRFLAGLDDQSGDDKTLVIAVSGEGPAGGPGGRSERRVVGPHPGEPVGDRASGRPGPG